MLATHMTSQPSCDEEELQRALDESRRLAEASCSRLPPLLSAPLPLPELAREYSSGAHAELYEAKAAFLARRYRALLRVRGDGNCLYRAFHVSWVEWLLQLQPRRRAYFWEELVPFVSARLSAHLPAPLGEELLQLGRAVATRVSIVCREEETKAHLDEDERVDATDFIRWLRLLTSAHMRAHAAAFEPYCASGTRPFARFLAMDVERMGVEADEMQVRALTAALHVRVRVEYLGLAGHCAWSRRCGTHRCVLLGPPEDGEGARSFGGWPRTPLVACLLFRPGHYDVLSPWSWEDSSLDRGDETAFVPPLPPRAPPAAAAACGGCGRRLCGCWLCGEWVCPGPRHRCLRFGCPAGEATPPRDFGDDPPRELSHLLPAEFGLEEGTRGTVCPLCFLRCPKASGDFSSSGVNVFCLLRCACGRLEFAPAMASHVRKCAAAKEEPIAEQARSSGATTSSEQMARRLECQQLEPAAEMPPLSGLSRDNSTGLERAFPAASAASEVASGELRALMDMGFPSGRSSAALRRTRGDVQAAADLLVSMAEGEPPQRGEGDRGMVIEEAGRGGESQAVRSRRQRWPSELEAGTRQVDDERRQQSDLGEEEKQLQITGAREERQRQEAELKWQREMREAEERRSVQEAEERRRVERQKVDLERRRQDEERQMQEAEERRRMLQVAEERRRLEIEEERKAEEERRRLEAEEEKRRLEAEEEQKQEALRRAQSHDDHELAARIQADEDREFALQLLQEDAGWQQEEARRRKVELEAAAWQQQEARRRAEAAAWQQEEARRRAEELEAAAWQHEEARRRKVELEAAAWQQEARRRAEELEAAAWQQEEARRRAEEERFLPQDIAQRQLSARRQQEEASKRGGTVDRSEVRRDDLPTFGRSLLDSARALPRAVKPDFARVGSPLLAGHGGASSTYQGGLSWQQPSQQYEPRAPYADKEAMSLHATPRLRESSARELRSPQSAKPGWSPATRAEVHESTGRRTAVGSACGKPLSSATRGCSHECHRCGMRFRSRRELQDHTDRRLSQGFGVCPDSPAASRSRPMTAPFADSRLHSRSNPGYRFVSMYGL
ncbi:hypothetical protein AB1Y20_004809 [Prymnesium parvum]|uniref:ubiquitinyl hydrolase 1 n=1 Tax=Prymnesium parvum TaxID=97485 RepID=A0AB34J0B9_PRYPA